MDDEYVYSDEEDSDDDCYLIATEDDGYTDTDNPDREGYETSTDVDEMDETDDEE